jgi:hypothetical protein
VIETLVMELRGANMELRDKLMELDVELQEQVETVTSSKTAREARKSALF